MNAKRTRLINALRNPPEGWTRSGGLGLGIKWERTQPFPPDHHMRDWPGLHGGHPYANWGPEYWQAVTITLVSRTGMPLVRWDRCPWVTARTSEVTLTRALAILADPATALETP